MTSVSKIDDDRGIPKLRSYLAAILDVKEKQLTFLPCYNGYLIFVDGKKPICIWVHKLTIEGILKVGFNLITEEFLFKLIWGGTVLKELLKGVIPEVPKDTLIFYPGLHRIIYGSIIPESGTSGIIVKGINKATDLVNKTSKGLISLIPSDKKIEREKTPSDEKLLPFLQKTFVYMHFQDFLYSTLSKEKLFKSSLPISNGIEFRTVFENESELFIKKLEKGGFKTTDHGEKGYI